MPLKPAKPRRKRAAEPKPFTGYIHEPLCEACEQGLDTRPKAPGAPPPMIIFTRGRRRTVDTSGQFCPDHDCSYHGWLGRGNIRSNGHPGGRRWRQFQCVSCQGYFYETHGTIFHGKRSSPDLIVQVIACLAEGLGIRGTVRVFEINANTVLSWLVETAEQLKAFSSPQPLQFQWSSTIPSVTFTTPHQKPNTPRRRACGQGMTHCTWLPQGGWHRRAANCLPSSPTAEPAG
jgi:transposase-like protein